MEKRGKTTSEEDELLEFESQLIVAWPGPNDPPEREVRLAGMVIIPWPQADGSILYEVKYRGTPFEAPRRRSRHRDTVQMGVLAQDVRKK